MFSLKEFIKKGLLDAIGKLANYQVIMNAVGWMEKGVLDEADLAEINEKIDAQFVVETEETVDEIVEETVEETEEITDVISEEVTEEV